VVRLTLRGRKLALPMDEEGLAGRALERRLRLGQWKLEKRQFSALLTPFTEVLNHARFPSR
jgi:hypothetical protein